MYLGGDSCRLQRHPVQMPQDRNVLGLGKEQPGGQCGCRVPSGGGVAAVSEISKALCIIVRT